MPGASTWKESEFLKHTLIDVSVHGIFLAHATGKAREGRNVSADGNASSFATRTNTIVFSEKRATPATNISSNRRVKKKDDKVSECLYVAISPRKKTPPRFALCPLPSN